MSHIDYTCYTVPECSSDEDETMIRRRVNPMGMGMSAANDSSDGTLENALHTEEDSDATTTTSSMEQHYQRQQWRQQQQQQRLRYAAPQRISLPTRELTPQLGVYHDPGSDAEPQWGYFLPLAPNCFFSPPMQRRRTRCLSYTLYPIKATVLGILD